MKVISRGWYVAIILVVLIVSGCTRARATGVTPASAAPALQGTAIAPPGTATISLVPDKTSVSTGDTFKVDIRVAGVQDLYAADVRLQFDPAKLEVVDANPNVPGVQIEVGNFLNPSGGQGFVAQNSADNAAGRISYAVTLLSPAKPVSGEGSLATITFKAKESGTPTVSFLNVLLTMQNNATIPATPLALGAPSGQAPAGGAAQATAGPGAGGTAPAATGAATAPTGGASAAATSQPTTAPSGAGGAQATPATQATVAIQPATSNVAVNGTTTVNVRVSNVTNMFGADVRLSFDPAILQVEDADPNQPGVQVTPGDCFPAGSQTARNIADNAGGTITFAASRVAPTPAVNGACTVISIRFLGKAAGTSAINFSRAPQLADTSGTPINASTSNGTVTVGGGGGPTPGPTTGPRATPTMMPGPTGTPGPGSTPGTPGTPFTGNTCTYTVRAGDTLSVIAFRYGTTAAAIAAANNLGDENTIYVGQQLTIPNCSGGPAQPTPTTGTGNCFTYTVRPGDTLLGIARRYGTSPAAIGQANEIFNPNLIRIGQHLIVCPGAGGPISVPPSPTGRLYIVKPGDTLTGIALRFGTTPFALAQANRLPNLGLIYAGQALRVP